MVNFISFNSLHFIEGTSDSILLMDNERPNGSNFLKPFKNGGHIIYYLRNNISLG